MSKKNRNTQTTNKKVLFSDDIGLFADGKQLINRSKLSICSETKYCAVGRNGVGKTSLLRCLYDMLKDKINILMIEQDIQLGSDSTILDFMLRANEELYEKYLKSIEYEAIEDMTDDELQEYTDITDYLDVHGWDGYEAEALKILSKLGFDNVEYDTSTLSGGWRNVLAIGKSLLTKPEILILDEPTNHLDVDATIWLIEYLKKYKKTVVVVTHQMDLVDEITDFIWYIGNPDGKGNKLITISGKSKQLEQTLEEIENSNKKSNNSKSDIIRFNDVHDLDSSNIIEYKNVSFKYDSNKTNTLSDIELGLYMKSRIVIIGKNGCGKTTLFKLANGTISPSSGDVIKNPKLRIAYYHQQLIDTMPLDSTPMEFISSKDESLDKQQCRIILSKTGIKKQQNGLDLANVKIRDMSGGQKVRTMLASIQMTNPHLILFDEPTNHLDFESVRELISAINNFDGGIMIISHDVFFIKRIENKQVYLLCDGSISKFTNELLE